MSAEDQIWLPQNDRLRQARRAIDEAEGSLVPPAELNFQRVGGTPGPLVELWQARRIIRTLTERNLRVRYKQSLLGFGWAILTPLALLGVLTIVFSRGVGLDTGDVPYPLFAFIGLVPWTFFAAALTSGGVSILSDKALLNKCRFPREVFPLSAVAVAAADSMMTLVPLLGIFVWFGRIPGPTALLAVLPLLVLLAFTVGVTLLLSALVVYFRDVRLVLPLVVQVGLFVTPVAYDMDLVPGHVRSVYAAANPVAPVIDALRSTVLLGSTPDWSELGLGALTATLTLAVGYTVFKHLEGGLADVA